MKQAGELPSDSGYLTGSPRRKEETQRLAGVCERVDRDKRRHYSDHL